MKKIIFSIVIFSLLSLPILSFGQSVGSNVTLVSSNTGICPFSSSTAKFADLLNYATCIILRSAIPLVFALAMVLFVWGVVQYVINTDEEAKRAQGRQFMIWGIIALTVMVSVWGLVAILRNTFGIENIIPRLK